ncbi:hypothetical protein [Rodentibacter pneumotropicus]|uniref:Uncharacterized protein n=1 Tax=Rodentibacter pneumotropicus TaxID=758 RepID=A0A3S4TVY1_9PAST|nr:hypothetical protein [Rodentibacter pneumotropicus]MDC2824605.1 hypothetical protein [Rodentibacter pneumotropicus]OOF62037.1 hypothetical protein BKL50_06575 [Rodentibacter pneumotropicus]THA00475.1 hypothetical protein D3M79_04095 [Rodentibacter pneumotropicus]THA00726.1 hypothetical protein D3M74_07085 [Rodentibacter pneumotropicus]THA02352.1 hypothetical protein D3M72_06155 [Rodentibacter pneumotropicus]
MTQPQKQVFVSAINGTKFDVQNALTASLLSKNEKKEIVHLHRISAKAGSVKQGKGKSTTDDNEQEIS